MDQCYFNGEFYQCIDAAGVNESPTANPEKWSRLLIHVDFRRVLTTLTHAHLLELDGQSDKALVVRTTARNLLDDIVRYAANREGWRPRPTVITR
jgi:hypothetical protein